MTLPVSSYEELLARVRSLTHETIQLQRELTTPLVDHNENERPLITTCCDAISTCDNKKRGVASVGWTTPTGGTQHQAGQLSGDGGLHRPHRSGIHRRSVSNPAEEAPPGLTGAAAQCQSFGWSGRGAHRQPADTIHFQNGSVGNEELSAASVLARLGVTVDARASLVRDRPASLLSGRIGVTNKENVMDEPKEEDEKKTAELCRTKNNDGSSSEVDGAGGDSKMTSSATQTQQENQNLAALYCGTWPVERTLWHSGPSSIGGTGGSKGITQDVPSVVSFTSSMNSASGCLPTDEVAAARRTYSQQQLGAKVEMVYNLLSMLGTHDREDMSRTLLAMSSSPDSCVAMRQSGCLPLLVQLLHAPDSDADTRQRAARVLHNMVHSHPDDKRSRREARVLRLLEQVREYCDSLREMIRAAATVEDGCKAVEDDMERHPGPTIAALMKLSFDEEHRHAMCQLGGLHAVAELIQVDHEAHGSTTSDQYCVTLRRYAGMALTNLTFGDGANKALLCSFRHFMKALVAQLKSPSEDLRQVTASVLRNLSWRADGASKQTLREVGAVSGLMQAAMEGRKESTLKSILSALWNLSAHCSINKVDICAVEGALGFLVDMLSYKAPSKTLAIVENAGGILRNISSHVAVREDYRAILREHSCLQVLLQQLKSPSLTVVSNACGTLWNLSARCAEDQRALWDMGAVSMLRSLVHSKHKMISMGSSAALKNLLSAKPNNNFPPLDSTVKGLGLPALPSLYARKQRALEQELDQTLSETCDNIEPSTSPSASTVGLRDDKFVFSTTERCFGSTERHQSRMCHSYQHHPPSSRYHSKGVVARSDSRDSVTSTLSDTVYERVSRTIINPFSYGQALPTNGMLQGLTGSVSDSGRINSQMSGGENADQRFLRRYCNSMKEREENRHAEPLNLSTEDNTQHSLLQHSHELYQHTRLGQISEANPSDPAETQKNIVDLSKETHVGSHQSSVQNENDAKLPEKREECDETVSPTVQSDTSSTKQPKNLFYGGMRSSHQRSAFGPVVAGSYGQPSNKPQYQHLTQQKSCVTTSHAAVRTKYSDFAYDDDAETQEQPVDYSLKYVEGNAHQGDTDVATTEISNIKTGSDQEGGGPEEYQSSRNTSTVRGKQNQNDLGRGYPYRHAGSIHVSKNMKMNVVYGDYAETDLDQPTDYSLKYAEENEDIEFEKNHEISSRGQDRAERNYYDGADPIHEDTLKTYCTEGTPYETPYNFSNATSMSDLHCEPPTPVSEESGDKKQAENYSKDGSIEDNAIRSVDENETSNSEDVSNFDKDFAEKGPQMKALPPAPRQPLKRLQSGLSSGLLSPEKPIQYCVEGTPGCFSRVSSLSSLSSVPANVDNTLQAPAADTDHSISEPERKPQKDDASSLAESGDKAVEEREVGNSTDAGEEAAGQTDDMKEEQHRGEREGKVVTFGGADHYAEETPLMFSRCSSLCSLSSIEQHSIHDDRSSVISDFSRRTSGIVSPSELPDSPTQTVPTSPRHTRPPVEFTSRLVEQRAQPVPANTHHGEISHAVKGSVFEDRVVAFKEEDTPVEFSRATSLSSLTIDDEPKISNDAMLKEVVGKPSSYTRSSNLPTGIHHAGRLELVGRDREEGMEKQDVEKEKRGELADCCELAPVSEGEEENDEDMLAACINIGMQNSRQRQCQYSIENANKNVQVKTHQATGISRLQTSRVQSHTLRSGRPSGIPVKTPPNNSLRQEKLNQPTQQEGVGEGTSKSLNSMVVMLCNLVGTSEHPIQVPGGTCCEDAVRTFCDEGTPANISHTGSHSDLSVLSLAGDRDETEAQKGETHLEGVNVAEESVGGGDGEAERPELSDDSSNFSGDNDNILAECIQSGMPKAHQTSRRILAQPGSMSIASSSVVPSQEKKKIPTVVPGVTVSVLPPRHPSTTSYRPPTHHLCGLSHSSPRSINKKPSPLTCCPRPKATEQHMPRHKPAVKNGTGATQNTRAPKSKLSGILQGPNMLPQCLAAKDEVEVYAFEGSPNECCDGCAVCLQRFASGHELPRTAAPDIPSGFSTENTPLEVSHAASLSSLNVDDDDDDDDDNDDDDDGGGGRGDDNDDGDEFNTVMKAVEPSASGPHNTGPNQSSEVSVSITYPSESGPRSCVSPLNKSVDNVTAEATAHVMVGSDGSWGDHSDKHDDSTSSKLLNKTSSVSEDVVTVLSRNDSLSSLSVDSFGSTEPTPSEQALLEQCISSGMPKSKSEGGCGKARIVVPVSTKKKISGGVCKIPLAVGDKRQGDGERSGPVIPGVPLQKLELKPVARIHCGSRMGVVGAVGNDIPCPNLQNDVHTCAYEIGQIPKNGVDASAALGPKEMAAGVDESIAAIASIQNLRDHPGSSSDLAENTSITQINSSCVSTVRLANEAVSTDMGLDAADYEKQRLKESVNHICAQRKDGENDDAFRRRTVLEKNQDRLDMKLEVSKGASSVCCLSNKTDSPHESTSDDNNSPYASADSPSPDFGNDVKVAECNRNRKDPDAMIASLDHLTEEIVRQVQDVHVQKEKNKDYSIMKQSDTWNEDTSPNDVSFPSMSTSAPLVASFKSEDGAVILPDLVKEDDLMNKISEEQQDSSLTDSHMIEVEAGKLAVSVQAEGQNLPYPSAEELEHSLTSMNSVDLDAIKPPSMMGSLVSLTASLSGQLDNGESGETREHQNSSSLPPPQPRNNGTRLECRHSRKKSLPAGMMVRRALGNNNHTGSIENLQDNTSVSSSCNSHLDNIKPPSAMEELIDIVDMENSMVSVASITSEVADSSTKEQSTSEQSPGNSDAIFELIKPAASVMAEVYAAAMSTSVRTSSASDCLDNINPPSAFNEVADLADPESVIEPGTETICSDTEMYTEEPGCAHSMEKLDEVDAPDFLSDTSRKATPTDQYMSSSADSTPKKRGQLTPKQKRQLAKERYKTYTITAEEELSIKKSDNNTSVVPPQPEISLQVLEAEACGCVRGPENLERTVQQEEKEKGHNKVTPKQRRLEDRQRFQTRVLDKSPSVDIEHGVGAQEQDRTAETEGNPCQEECTKSMHIDTAKQKTSTIKTLKQKRAEAKERFQTRTLSEESKPQQKCNEADNDGHTQTNHGTETINLQCSNVGFVEALLRVRPDEIESLLEHDANIVITTLNDSRRRNSESSELPSSDEMLLECETLSLISIESESDQNSSICRFGKRRGSDLLVRESSVTEEPGMSHTEKAFVEEKVSEQIEADTEDRESVADSETSQEDGNDDANNDDLPKTRGPRIVKPEERLKQEESADSNCTEDGTPQNNSPKSIRGRRKALYSSPASKKAIVPPIAGKIRSSIPVISGAASNVKPTKASVLRQTGRGTPQRYVSKTPPSSTEGRLPRNTSPKSNRSGRRQQLNQNSASPPAKTSSSPSSSSSSRNTGITHTPGKDSNERDSKDPKFKPPERQGTFTKEEPNTIMPLAMPPPSPTKTRIPIPASVSTAGTKLDSKSKKTCGAIKQSHSVNSTTSKMIIHKEKSAPTLTRCVGQSRFTKNCSNDISTSGKGSPAGNSKSLTKAATIPGRNGTTRSPPAPRVGYKRGSIGAQEGMKTSLSNQSLQSNDSGKTVLKQGTVQPQRSNSNSSLNSVASGGGTSSKRTAGTRKEVTSKIASLWKRVEESKSKQKAAKKDTRVWITATHVENGSDGNIMSSDILSASRLVRSSTFEGLPSMSANNDEVDQDTRIRRETDKANKTKTEITCLRHPRKCESTGSCSSEDFTDVVASQELSNVPRQIAQVAGMVIVQPAGKGLAASGCCLSKDRDEAPSQQVVLRRQHQGYENKGPDSETPKRLSRLGSFIRIDSPEEEVVGSRDSKSVSRTPASAIVQPFNYVPPTSTAGSYIPTPVTSTAKRSESYLGGLGHVEQVKCDQAEVIDEHVSEFNTVSMRVTTV